MWTVENRGSYDRGGLRYPSDVTDDEWVFKLFDDRIPVGLNPIAVLTRRRVQPRPKRLIVEIGWQRPGQPRRLRPGKHMRNRPRAHPNRICDLRPRQRQIVTVPENIIEEIVEEQRALASADLVASLSSRDNLRFDSVLGELLERYMLRETNIKDICVELAAAGRIVNTWGKGNRKPSGESLIKQKVASEEAVP